MASRTTSPGFRDPRYRDVIDQLVARRRELKLTQQNLADRIGLHKQFVSRVELGERRLDFVELVDFARALNLDPAGIVAEIPAG
jgi:transcriptional regulator with XRE-family HTH domain